MTIQITINGVVQPNIPETVLAAIKAEYPEWPGSVDDAMSLVRWLEDSQDDARNAMRRLQYLMTAINGDYTGWPRWAVYLRVDNNTLQTCLLDFTQYSPIWFKSREAAEHAIKIASQEFRLFNGVNEKV